MSEIRTHGEQPAGHAELDREIHVRTFAWFGLGLVALTLVSLFAMWLLFRVLARQADKSDPAPSPLVEASERHLPPAPNLQVRPETDLATLRAREQVRLHAYGWVDQSQGIAHIPIERAMEIVARRAAEPVDVTPAPDAAAVATPAPTPPAGEGHH